jgi:outer membrane protein OmpA-like peptidoglycan-associated protein
LFAILGTAALLTASAFAQEPKSGKLKIDVTPDEAYMFVDGNAMTTGDKSIELTSGLHKLLFANYGYKGQEREVNIIPDETAKLNIILERQGDVVFGPKGRIQIEVGNLHGATDDAVLLNGKTPAYFVGHIDEFNHDIIWHQELVVPPGSHAVTITRNGKEVWSGVVPVSENQRVIVDISNGKMKTKEWARGKELGSVERFKAGIASATVAIAPVSSSIYANPVKIDCGQNSQLRWTSAETIDADISGMSPVPLTGERYVSPRKTTTYELTATGPGGITKSSATVEVNPVIHSTLTALPMEIRYRRIGDKVVEVGHVNLQWTTSNADNVNLNPLGIVDTNGDRSLVVRPVQTTNGEVNETVNYTLSASNVCGGIDTKSAAVHIIGSIEPIPDVLLHSVFFPTDYPTKDNPSVGLLRSQQDNLKTIAANFMKYLDYDPDAKLNLSGFADERASNEYNQVLSERRVERVKEFLVAQGISDGKIDTEAFGEEKPIEKADVVILQAKNPNQAPDERVRNFTSTWLAYNRRVDVTLLPTNAESLRFYPNSAPDSDILWQQKKLNLEVIEQHQ